MGITTSPAFLNSNIANNQRAKAQSNVRFDGYDGPPPNHPHHNTTTGGNMTGGADNQPVDGRSVGTVMLFVYGGFTAIALAGRYLLKYYHKRKEAQAAAQRQPANTDVEQNTLDELSTAGTSANPR